MNVLQRIDLLSIVLIMSSIIINGSLNFNGLIAISRDAVNGTIDMNHFFNHSIYRSIRY